MLLRLTQAMLAAAERQEWDRLAELETERRRILSVFFDPSRSRAETAVTTSCAQQILDLDRQVIALAESGLRGIAGELANLERWRRAHRAYSDAAG